MMRKIAVAAASKPAVEIKQENDTFYIKTSTTVRTTEINFKIGEEFEEQTVDGRPCKVRDREGPLPVIAPTRPPCLSMSSFPRLFALMREPLGGWKGVCLFSRSLAQALTVSSLASGLL